MIDLGKAIFSRLTTYPACGSLVGNRVYPAISPENRYPLITYQVGEEPEESIDPLDLKEFTVTITVEARTYKQARQLHRAQLAALDGQGGQWGGVEVRGFYMQSTDEDADQDGGSPEETFYAVETVYRVFAYEPVE